MDAAYAASLILFIVTGVVFWMFATAALLKMAWDTLVRLRNPRNHTYTLDVPMGDYVGSVISVNGESRLIIEQDGATVTVAVPFTEAPRTGQSFVLLPPAE